MGEEGLSKKFIRSIILLVSARNLVKDDFFYNKFTDKIFNFGSSLLSLQERGKQADVAQYKLFVEKCFSDINDFGDILKELRYLNLMNNSPLMLEIEHSLLDVRFEILKSFRGVKERDGEVKNNTAQTQVYNDKPAIRIKPKKSGGLNDSKKKILEYIKSYPNTRTKDIIYEFNALSGRTVKRNLTDLIRVGLVKKRIDNKAVYYYANEVQS